jgi:hypothetical protein
MLEQLAIAPVVRTYLGQALRQPPIFPTRRRNGCAPYGGLCLFARSLCLALLVCAAALPLHVGPAGAQDVSQPLEFEVRPSGVEESTEDRLERRLKQREHLFRSICIQCGRGDRFQSNAPFNPIETLRKPVGE